MTVIRRDIWTLSTPAQPFGKVVLAYAKAITQMQQLPGTDPRSWEYQASIHGTYTTPVPFGAPWNTCQHSTWYFLPWHRMYLFQLENIVRSFLTAAEAKIWALPYWNYSQGAPSNSLPPCFREQTLPDGSPNPLFVPQRRASVNAGNPLPAGVTNIQTALSEDQFVDGASGTTPAGFGGPVTGFAHFGAVAGELENLPHNVVHVSVGGPGGLMTDPNTAALDPIFYLHHSNIDRLWNLWLTTAPHANPTSAKWLNKSFKLRDASGAKVTMKTKDVLDTVAQLDYKYA